jgi:hypothetical protein
LLSLILFTIIVVVYYLLVVPNIASWFVFCIDQLCFPPFSDRDQNVLDNEGMGRKSSKRCCIFHKDRPFGESSTDSSEDESHRHDDNGKRIAHKKSDSDAKPKKTPDHLRFHA